jgi:hypothetical protein
MMEAVKSNSRPRFTKHVKRYEQVGTHIYCPKCSYHCHYKKTTTMSMHYINEHEEKRFVCIECDKGFGSRCNYLQHMQNAHSEERPYKCPCCPVQTKTKGNLLNHYGKVHVNDAEKKRMMQYFTGGDFICVDCKKPCKKTMINYHVAYCSPCSVMSKNYHRTDDALGLWINSLDAEKRELDAIDALIAIVDE